MLFNSTFGRFWYLLEPAPVDKVNVKPLDSESAEVSWNKPEGNVDFYRIKYGPKTGLQTTVETTENDEAQEDKQENPKHVIHNLQSGTMYSYAVFSVSNSIESTGQPYLSETGKCGNQVVEICHHML